MASYFDSDNGDSDDEIESNVVETFGALPYQYEPRRLNRIEPIINEVHENVGGAANNEDIGRVGNVEWCRCGNCVPMLTCQESICCKEIEEVAEKICVGQQ
jgi:hypothetical protein